MSEELSVSSLTTVSKLWLGWTVAGAILLAMALAALSPPAALATSSSISVLKLDAAGGTVVSSPAGIYCGSTCSFSFTQGQSVTFTATSAAGYTFTGWTGYGCAGTDPCTVTIGQAGTLVANFATGFSVSDLAGTWYFLNQGDSAGGNDPYWVWATITLDGAGAVTGGTYANSYGGTGTFTGGAFTINGAGLVSGSVTTAGGSMSFPYGKLDVHKGILGMVTAEPDPSTLSRGLGLALKAGGSFSAADLAGTWYIEDFDDSTTANDPSWAWGAITLDSSGSVTGGEVTSSDGSTDTLTGGSFTIDGNGVVTGSVTSANGTHTFPYGKLDEGKTALAMVKTESHRVGLTVVVKGGGGLFSTAFSTTDLAGTWYLASHADGVSTNGPYWSAAMVTLDASGAVIGGGYSNSFGESGIVTGGSFSIDAAGTVSGSATSDSGTISFPHGKLDAGKTFAVMASSEPASGTLTDVGQAVMAKGVSVTGTLSVILTVTKEGTGSGTVTSSPAGIDCGSTCSASFAQGTAVTLTATAASGSTFAGWSGACTGTGDCAVTMDQARSVTASFATSTYTLTVTVTGSSSGSVTSSPAGISGCTTTCVATYNSGVAVTLTASAGAGGTFREWRGACTGSGACLVTMNGTKSVTAVFSKTFTDSTLTAGVTPVKAVHMTDLRTAIDTLRGRHSLSAYTWTDGSLTPGSTPVKRAHLIDLRTALNPAYTAAGRAVPTYTDATITAGTTPIKASHLTELRTFVRNLE